MSERDLPGLILENVRERPLQNSRATALEAEARGVLAELRASSTGFHADKLHLLLRNELVEHSDSVRASTDAGDDSRGKLAFCSFDLLLGFPRDDAVEIAYHRRIRMRS